MSSGSSRRLGRYTVQLLSGFLSQVAPEQPTPIAWSKPEPETEVTLSFLATLNFLLQFCPTHPTDATLMDRFAKIGVGPKAKADPNALSVELQSAIKRGLEDGNAAITAAAADTKSVDIFGTRKYLKNDHMKLAVAAKVRLHGNSKEETLSSLYLTDAAGKPLDGNQTSYVLKLSEKDLPQVNAFWSITMYDGQSHSLVDNPINRFQINSSMLPDLKHDGDGVLNLHIQRESPGEEMAANWLPAANGPFYIVMRLYWPKTEAYDGSWTPPLVWSTDSAPKSAIPKPPGAGGTDEVKPSVLADVAKPEMERPTIWGEPTEVQIGLYVIDVDDVNSADQSFAASVYIEAHWMNPLLRHKGPGPMHRGITEVWNPRLTIIGQQMVWRSYPESVEIQPDGKVIYRQKLWGRFSQPLDLREFPFDQQELSIHVVAAGLLEGDAKMVPLVIDDGPTCTIASSFSLPDFDVLSFDASNKPYVPRESQSGVAGFEMRIKIARQVTFYVLKIVIPLSLIVMMSWLPRWIDPEQTGTNIGISTSAFLTLVAYLFAVTVLLPRVSYVTRIDRFILLSTLMVFFGLIQTVFNTAMLRKKKNTLVDRVERWSRATYPLLLVLVLLISFAA